jgi:hypothetical protein
MAEPNLPAIPPGIAGAIASGRMVTPADILQGGVPASTVAQEPPQQQQNDVKDGAVNVATSVANYINSLPDTSGITAKNTQGTDMIAQGKIAVNDAIAKAKAKEIQDNATAAAYFGLTPGATDGVIAKYSMQIADSEAQLDAKRQEILGKQQQSFFDNPISWFFNQLALPYDIAEFHTLSNTATHKLDILKRLEDATLEAFKVNAGVDQATAAAVLDGQNKAALGEALVNQAASEVQVGHLGVQETSVRMQGTMDAFNASVAQHQAWVSDQNLAVNQATLDINKRQIDNNDARLLIEQNEAKTREQQAQVNLSLSKINLDNAQLQAEGRADINNRLMKIAQTWKMTPITAEQLNMMSDGPLKQFLMSKLIDPNIQEGKAPALGYDAVDAVSKANAINAPLTPGMNIVREKLIKIESDIIGPQQFTWKQLDPSVQHIQLQNAIQAEVKKEVNNIPDQGGIFSPGSLRATLSIGQGEASLANTKIGAALAPAAKADPTLPTSASMILQTALQLIQAGKATPAEMASEVNRIYTAIIADNNDQRQYQEFRLNPLDPQINGFKTSVQFGNDWGSKAPVNMVSPSAVEAVLTRMLLRQTYQLDISRGGMQ